jgi:hypothetical protein
MAYSLRPFLGRLRQDRTSTVEALAELHESLVHERQQLRSGGADLDRLEQNRIEIVRCQWELAHALIERYLPQHVAARTAAA